MLEPGHHADLVVIDRDPLVCPIGELPGTQVITTMLGGVAVHGTDWMALASGADRAAV